MPKRKWSEQERQAQAERMREMHEKKAEQAKLNQETHESHPPEPVEEDTRPEVTPPWEQPEPIDPGPPQEVNVAELQKQIQELQAAMFLQNLPTTQQAKLGPQGLIGTTEKYIVDPGNYPDPCERLSVEQKLQRFAFPMNYELEFKVTSSEYQTVDGRRMREPKFTLDLIRIIIDEDTGLATNGRYTVCRAIFHEDPEAAIVIAREQGLPVDESNEKAFLDEMRYIRMRDWLLEAFYPPKAQEKQNKKEVVIGGKLVEYFEVNSEDRETIPFGQLKTKL